MEYNINIEIVMLIKKKNKTFYQKEIIFVNQNKNKKLIGR